MLQKPIEKHELRNIFGYTIGTIVELTDDAKNLLKHYKEMTGEVVTIKAYARRDGIAWNTVVKGADQRQHEFFAEHLQPVQ